MSWMTQKEIVRRLKSASKTSPLAVFRNNPEGKQYEGLYDVVFANTAVAQQRIAQGSNLVGVYSRPYQFSDNQAGGALNDRG
ncbi:hypothetical protein [Microbulbifer sp. 2205BS26-8]|uniref:hypothetical protein n=1 Tax=Microbulbifer sp. 2205BS26-8 TaxID=3064386 RepID=UPI00274022CD|nr:hypothetical protein [Microbulbifer sp. 2205BS26-8]MDP5211179.1 hypothetical protein [Microbulbifer sp. 2205BS26-8]